MLEIGIILGIITVICGVISIHDSYKKEKGKASWANK